MKNIPLSLLAIGPAVVILVVYYFAFKLNNDPIPQDQMTKFETPVEATTTPELEPKG